MKNRIFILSIFSSFNLSYNTTFSKQKDYTITLSDLNWHRKIEGQVGEVNIKGHNILYGRNANSTFIEISASNGKSTDTLHPYSLPKERECLITDST